MINKTILLGKIESTPQISSFPNGTRVANFTLITTEKWKDGKTGLDKSRQDKHKIAVFNDRLVDLIQAHVHENSLIYVEGQIEHRSWTDAQGQPRSAIDIVIRPMKGTIVLLGEEKEHESNQQSFAAPL